MSRTRKTPPEWFLFRNARLADMRSVCGGTVPTEGYDARTFCEQRRWHADEEPHAAEQIFGPAGRFLWLVMFHGLKPATRCTKWNLFEIATTSDYNYHTLYQHSRRMIERDFVRLEIVPQEGVAENRQPRFIFPSREVAPNCHAFWDYRDVPEDYIPEDCIPVIKHPRLIKKKNKYW